MVIESWYCGTLSHKIHAVAEVLFGDYNPAGRTTKTWVQSIDQLPDMMDYDIRNRHTYMYFTNKHLHIFGHGQSYTTFEYSKLTTDKDYISTDDKLKLTVNIKK